jgi:hypothetical protein
MLNTCLIDNLVLRLVEAGAKRLLHLFGGPDHVPHRNEDFVWF